MAQRLTVWHVDVNAERLGIHRTWLYLPSETYPAVHQYTGEYYDGIVAWGQAACDLWLSRHKSDRPVA